MLRESANLRRPRAMDPRDGPHSIALHQCVQHGDKRREADSTGEQHERGLFVSIWIEREVAEGMRDADHVADGFGIVHDV